MSETTSKEILAIVTMNRHQVVASGKPVIHANNEEELQTLSSELGRTLGANVFRLANGLVIITEV